MERAGNFNSRQLCVAKPQGPANLFINHLNELLYILHQPHSNIISRSFKTTFGVNAYDRLCV
jgi:hypothetical protein